MSIEIDDGGPAFPGYWHPDMGWSPRDMSIGISLRDYFAAAALASVLSDHAEDWQITAWFGKNATGITKAQILSRRAYDIADAMIEARKGGGS